MSEKINVSKPEIDKDLSLRYLEEVLDSGQLAQGGLVERAEMLLADELSADYAALINNGTSSLKASIVAGIAAVKNVEPRFIDRVMPEGDVIVPAFSFNATLNAALQLGAKVKVVDILSDTFNIDPQQVEANAGDETLAVIPVDLYGQPADTRIYLEEFRHRQIAVVRDSAQAHGATIDGRPLSDHSDALSLSFYATKNINSGEGGAVLTNHSAINEIVRMYRNQGMKQRYHFEMVGDNLRLSELHAAVLLTQLGKIATYADIRQNNAKILTEQLEPVEGITTPHTAEGMDHVYHQYTVLVEPEFGMDRDDLANRLLERGIGSGIYYPFIMTAHNTYRNHPKIDIQDVPVAEQTAKKVLSLPIHTKLGEAEISRIAETVIAIQKEAKK